MCWSAEVSLHTFIFGVISAIIVYALNVIPIHVIIILLSFTSMQLLEYFAWTYMDNKKINVILSYIGLLLIIIQIFLIICFIRNKKSRNLLLITFSIVLILFILIEFKTITFKMTRGENGHLVWHWLDMPIIWIIIALLFYTIPSIIDKNYLLPNKKESRILLIAYSIFLILFILIELKNIKFKMTRGENGHLVWHWMDIPLPWAIIGVITFYLIPIYLSKSYIGVCFTGIIFFTSLYYYFKAKTWGTMWCYFSNIAWIFFIIKSIIIKLNIYI